MNPSDFIDVQLSAAGAAFAGDGATLRIGNGRFNYTFVSGTPVRVLTSEWRLALSHRRHDGAPILEPAPDVPAAASDAAAKAQPEQAAASASGAKSKGEVK
jgi:hypothetical protein